MKKVLVCFSVVLVCFCAFALNDQKVWSVNSDIFSEIRSLYLQEGLASPSATGPWTTAELKLMLSKVKNTDCELYKDVYEKLYNEKTLKADSFFDMKFAYHAAVTGYAHLNSDFNLKIADEQVMGETSNYIYKTQYSNKLPTLLPEWETWAGNNFYGYFSYPLQNEDFIDGDLFDRHNLNFDFAFLTREGFTSKVSQAVPFRAFVAAGGNHWTVQFGRDALNWGSGETGNLVMSNNFPYHQQIRFTAFGERFKYTFLMSFMVPPYDDGGRNYTNKPAGFTGEKGVFYYMAHRLESRFIHDRLSLALTESIVYQSEYGIDPRFVNPSMYYHNYFIKGNANSLVGLEADFAISKFASVYGQFVIDDLPTPVESSEGNTTPNAIGAMLGAKTSLNVWNGVLDASAEAVYTLPYLYHRSLDGNQQAEGAYGLNYIGIFKTGDTQNKYLRYFIGYPYGGDAMVLDVKADYKRINKFSAGAECFAMIHGSKYLDSLFTIGDMDPAPSGNKIFTGYLKLSGSYKFNKTFGAFTNLYFIRNNKQSDIQCVCGVTVN